MADYLRPLIEGMRSGDAANAARAKFAAEQAEKERKFALDLAGESRLTLGAAEDEWQRLEDSTLSESWDPTMTASLLDRAALWDKSYKDVTGRSAFDYFAKSLHVKPGMGGPQTEGKQGPASPSDTTNDRLYGFRTNAQRQGYETRAEDETWRKVRSEIPGGMASAIQKGAVGENGEFSPQGAVMAGMRYIDEITSTYKLDPKKVFEVTDEVWQEMAKVFEGLAVTPEQQAAYRKELATTSKDFDSWLFRELGIEDEFGNFIMDPGSEQLRHEAQTMGNTLAAAGLDLPTIKIQVLRRFTGDGKWLGGEEIRDPWTKNNSAAPEWFAGAIQGAYNAGTDPSMWEPVWDEQSKTGGLYNKTADIQGQMHWIPLQPPQSPYSKDVPVPESPRMPTLPEMPPAVRERVQQGLPHSLKGGVPKKQQTTTPFGVPSPATPEQTQSEVPEQLKRFFQGLEQGGTKFHYLKESGK